MTSYPIFSLSFSCHHITPSFSVSRPTLKAFPLVLLKKKGLNPLGFTGSLGFTLSNRSTVLAGKENEETMRDRPKHLLYRVLGLSEKCQQGLARGPHHQILVLWPCPKAATWLKSTSISSDLRKPINVDVGSSSRQKMMRTATGG